MMSTLVRIDAYSWRASAVVASLLARLAQGKTYDDRPVIIRPGGLGDLVVATAALENLGLRPSDFDWIIETRSAHWAEHLGLTYRCYDDRSIVDGLRWTGSKTCCVNTEQRYGLAGAFGRLLLASAGEQWGFSTNRAASTFAHVIEYEPVGMHELHAFQRLLGRAFKRSGAPAVARARVEPAHDHTVVALAGSGHPSREWNANDWVQFIQRFVSSGSITLTAAPKDRALGKDIAERLGDICELHTGEWDQLCSTVRSARRVLTVDGGMVHVASYYGVPVDAIFTSSSDAKWRPWSSNSRIIKRTDIPCQPCNRFGTVPPCPWNLRCKDSEHWEVLDSTLFPP